MAARTSTSAVVRLVDALPRRYYRRGEVAESLGLTPTAIDEIGKRNPALRPGHALDIGNVVIYLWTEEEVEALRARGRSPQGRPRIWTLEESAWRTYRRRMLRMCRQEAARAEARGDHERSTALLDRAAGMKHELDEQARQRSGR